MEATPEGQPEPAITVLVRVYNAERHLAAAIDSILAQTFTDFELVCSLRPSEDRSEEILRSYDDPRIRIVPQLRPGKVGAAIDVFAHARAKLVAIQDADDLSEPERLARQKAAFDADDDLVLVGSATRIIDESGATLGIRRYPQSDSAIRRSITIYNVFAHSAVMFRRANATAQGGYVARFVNEDYSLWLRLIRTGKARNFFEPLVSYRIRTREPADHFLLLLRATVDVRKAAFAEYGYRRTILSRTADLGYLILSIIPPAIVGQVFRATIQRSAIARPR